jgi:hypothetical protein
MARKLHLKMENPGKKLTVTFIIPISNSLSFETAKKAISYPLSMAFSFPTCSLPKEARNGQGTGIAHYKHGKKFTDGFEIPISKFLSLQTAKKSV